MNGLGNNLLKDDENYEGIKALAEYLYSLINIMDEYSYDPIQMDKELNNYYYTKGEKLDELWNRLHSIEGLMVPSNFLKDYFTSPEKALGINKNESQSIKDEATFNELRENLDILSNNFKQMSCLNLQKIPNRKIDEKKSGIEKGPLKEIIEKIKREKLLTGGSKSKLIFQKSKKIKINRPKFPDNLRWEQISIRFLNSEEVQITAGGLIYSSNAELMGFQDEKTKKPNMQWILLKLLSKKSGYLNWKNNYDLNIKEINRIKKQKQGLSEKLAEYFDISKESPFFDYKKEGGYKIKIQLMPETGSYTQISNKRDNKDIINDIYDDGEDEDFLKE